MTTTITDDTTALSRRSGAHRHVAGRQLTLGAGSAVVRWPLGVSAGRVVICCGAGGSPHDLAGLSSALAHRGYVVIHPHVAADDAGDHGVAGARRVAAVLDDIATLETTLDAVVDGIDAGQVVVVGSGEGADSALLLGGVTTPASDPDARTWRDERVGAVVALGGATSAPGSGDDDWAALAVPILLVVGAETATDPFDTVVAPVPRYRAVVATQPGDPAPAGIVQEMIAAFVDATIGHDDEAARWLLTGPGESSGDECQEWLAVT